MQACGICIVGLPGIRLNLGHSRTSASRAEGASQVDTAASRVHECEEQADAPQSEVEPKECGGSLFFATATSSVVSAIGKMVGKGVSLKRGVSE